MKTYLQRLVRWGSPVLALGIAGLAVGACGSSSPSSSSPASSSTSAGTTAQTAGQTAAVAYLNKYTPNPTSVGVPPLPSKPATGKSVIYLTTPEPVALRNSAGQAAAAKLLGWKYTAITDGATTQSAVSAFQAAIARHPNAIQFAGYPASVFTQEIKEADAAGITVFSDATGDSPDTPGVLADLGGAAQEQQFGKLTAAYFVAHGGAGAKAVVYNLAALPILADFSNEFSAAVKQWCSTCAVTSVPQQFSDVGTTTPSNVVSYLQRNPSVKWLVFGNGDLATGVAAALKSADITGVHIIGEVPTQSDLANVQAGSEEMWVGYPVDVLAWREIDLLARHFEDASVTAAIAPNLPAQPITKANINKVVVDGQYYVGVAGYQAKFAKIWHVS